MRKANGHIRHRRCELTRPRRSNVLLSTVNVLLGTINVREVFACRRSAGCAYERLARRRLRRSRVPKDARPLDNRGGTDDCLVDTSAPAATRGQPLRDTHVQRHGANAGRHGGDPRRLGFRRSGTASQLGSRAVRRPCRARAAWWVLQPDRNRANPTRPTTRTAPMSNVYSPPRRNGMAGKCFGHAIAVGDAVVTLRRAVVAADERTRIHGDGEGRARTTKSIRPERRLAHHE